MNAVEFDKVSIVFGEKPALALPLMDRGLSRAEVQNQTGQVLGVHDCSLNVANGEILVLMGLSGSGKSTSLAAMIHHRNANAEDHIITIEDPVEFVHKNIKSLVSHREIGRDTHSWFNALKNTLRQAPDVIFIGEVRERETMEYAIAFAETGHLAMATRSMTTGTMTGSADRGGAGGLAYFDLDVVDPIEAKQRLEGGVGQPARPEVAHQAAQRGALGADVGAFQAGIDALRLGTEV